LAKPGAVCSRTVNEFVLIAAAIAVELRCELDFKAVEFD
jgi:hypothetical protein